MIFLEFIAIGRKSFRQYENFTIFFQLANAFKWIKTQLKMFNILQ